MSGALLAAALSITPLRAVGDKSSVSGSGSGAAPSGSPGATDAVTITASGGDGSYSYAWTQVSANADSGPYQADLPTAATTTFTDVSNEVADADINSSETWRCTVTDGAGRTKTVDVIVTLTWSDTT